MGCNIHTLKDPLDPLFSWDLHAIATVVLLPADKPAK